MSPAFQADSFLLSHWVKPSPSFFFLTLLTPRLGKLEWFINCQAELRERQLESLACSFTPHRPWGQWQENMTKREEGPSLWMASHVLDTGTLHRCHWSSWLPHFFAAYFTGEEKQVQRGYVACPRLHRQKAVELRWRNRAYSSPPLCCKNHKRRKLSVSELIIS